MSIGMTRGRWLVHHPRHSLERAATEREAYHLDLHMPGLETSPAVAAVAKRSLAS